MAMKGYSTLPRYPKQEPHHEMQFTIIFRTLIVEEILHLCRDAVGIFYHLKLSGLVYVWLQHIIYHVTKSFQDMEVSAVVGSIVVVGVLTHCALLHSMYDLKVIQMNVQCSLNQEIMLYVFQLDHNFKEVVQKKWR